MACPGPGCHTVGSRAGSEAPEAAVARAEAPAVGAVMAAQPLLARSRALEANRSPEASATTRAAARWPPHRPPPVPPSEELAPRPRGRRAGLDCRLPGGD